MRPESKKRFRLTEELIDGILRPLGFTKKKAIWRRTIKEVLQQFSIVSKQRDEQFYPTWGLNIIRRCEDPAPLPWRLNAKWDPDDLIKEKYLDQRLRYAECFKFAVDLTPEIRKRRVTELFRKYIIPCFEMYTTEDSVRRMMGDRSAPLRALAYVGLPDEWWPGGGRPKSSGAPGPRAQIPLSELEDIFKRHKEEDKPHQDLVKAHDELVKKYTLRKPADS